MTNNLGLFFMEAEGDGANKKIDPAKFANKVLEISVDGCFKRDRDGDGIFLAKNMSDLVNNFNESDAKKDIQRKFYWRNDEYGQGFGKQNTQKMSKKIANWNPRNVWVMDSPS